MTEKLDQDTRSIDHSRLAVLYRVSQILGTSLDQDVVFNQVMDGVIELTKAERGFLALIDPDTKEITIRAARNFEGEPLTQEESESGSTSVNHSLIRITLEQGQGLISTNTQKEARTVNQESAVIQNPRSSMCTPLHWSGMVIGAIYVDNGIRRRIFKPPELELLSAFATQAAAVIANALLYAQVNQNLSSRIADLETLAQIDQQLNTNLDFNHVVETTYHWALQGTGADDGWLALCEPSEPGSNEPKLKIVAGRDKGQILNKSDPMAVRFLEKRSALDDNAGAEQPKEAKAYNFHATEDNPARLVIPILIAGRFIGMLSLERSTDFPESASQFLNRLVTHTGIAIENARLYQAVQIANETKSKFVSLVVHELRIPMTSIKGYNDLVRQGVAGPVTEMQQSFLNIIRNNVDRMAALVSDLSDISRIEGGRLKLEPVLTKLKSHVDEVVRGLEHEIKEKQQTLEIDIPDNLPPIFADPSRVVQILYNLVSNAWKYTPDAGKIIIRAFILDDMVQIEVEDSGIGINAEEQKKLFTQFFRSENPAVSEQPGWGLGLNVTRNLVELMNGRIGVQSTPGSGSKFWFKLPIHN